MLGKDEMKANHAKKLPYRFSWLEQGQLAGTSVPSTVAQLEGLVREGVSSGPFEFHFWKHFKANNIFCHNI